MQKSSRVLLIIIIIVAILLQITAAWQKSFWVDEAYTVKIAQSGEEQMVAAAAQDVHPPLFLYLIAWWGKLTGFNELGLRLFSILFSLITLILTFMVAYDLFGEKASLFAVALLGFSPLYIMFAHNVRYYSMAASLTLLVTFAMLRYRGKQNLTYLLMYIGGSTLFLNLLFSSFSVLLACNIWWFYRWLREKSRDFQSLLFWLLAQITIAIIYFPTLKFFIYVYNRFSETAVVSNMLQEILKRVAYFIYVISLGETLSPLNPLAWIGIITVAAIAAYAFIQNHKIIEFWLPIIFLLLISAVNIGITFNALVAETWQNLPYRTFYAIPFLAMLLSSGLSAMKPKTTIFSSGILLVVFLFGNIFYFSDKQFLRPIFSVPWRSIFSQITEKSQPEVLVICGHGDFTCSYYSERNGYGKFSPRDWKLLSEHDYSEVWWVQSNLARETSARDPDEAIREEISQRYMARETFNYSPQDPSIRWLKIKLFDQNDYEYRVNVYRFFNPP